MFQFHNGSIKSEANMTPTRDMTAFQFHNGSIKSCHNPPSQLQHRKSFNSTMVRLKVCKYKSSTPLLACFNSTMVRLKVCSVTLCNSQKSCFNSTMVRLKDIVAMAYQVPKEFQFHNGSIKRTTITSSRWTTTWFQFHNGSIKRAEISVNIIHQIAWIVQAKNARFLIWSSMCGCVKSLGG